MTATAGAARPGRLRSLRWRLAAGFALIAVLTAAVIGAILVPILAGHYDRAEATYLEAAAERAVRDLATLSWKDTAGLRAQAEDLAVITQARVTLTRPSGVVVADSGPPRTGLGQVGLQPLVDPLGAAFLGDGVDAGSLPRSDKTVRRPVQRDGKLLGSVEISEAPAFAAEALAAVVRAWALASLLGVLLAAVVGSLVAAWLSRPLRALTEASDRMARGDLGVRADVDRADEVGQLATSFNSMASRVEETVTTLRRFVADAAHEIGTPLTALEADLELARAHASTPDERRLLDRAETQARRLEDLSAGLLRLSRLEARDGASAPEPIDLCGVARRAADAVASRADQAEIDLRLEIPAEPVPVVGHPDALTTAVGNLLDNALKFTPAGGSVTLGVRADAGTARLWVSDTGIGIPPAELPLLFERFRRGRGAAAYPGSGLGLAIVRATMELDGGSVRAESDAAGSRFELALPVA
jgi:two-component system, OmpR family, sensor histidine kinase BaeS